MGLLPRVGGLTLALALSFFVVLGAPLSAQQVDEVGDRRQEYLIAQQAHQAAVSVWLLEEAEWRRATNALALAQSSNNRVMRDSLEYRVLLQSRALQQADLRVAEMQEQLDSARVALLGALDRRMERYLTDFDRVQNLVQRDSIGALIEDLRNQFRELEEADPEQGLLARQVLPAINFDPRDRPADLRNKAELAERQAKRFEDLIAEIDQELNRRRDFLRTLRLAGDARAGRDRFGDPQVPVTNTGGQRSGSGLAQDTTGIVLDDLPPEEAIALLETQKLQLERFQAEMLRRAQLFRDLIRAEDDR